MKNLQEITSGIQNNQFKEKTRPEGHPQVCVTVTIDSVV